MKKFEYKVLEESFLCEKELNYWGIDGWELVSIIQPYGEVAKFYFKREIVE